MEATELMDVVNQQALSSMLSILQPWVQGLEQYGQWERDL